MRFPLWRGAVALALLGLSASALAGTRIEVAGGRSDSDGYWTNTAWLEATFSERVIGHSRFTWAPDASLGFINGRHVARYGATVADDVWLLAGGVRFHYGESSDWYHHLFWTAQIAIQAGRTMALSSGGEFVNSVGWQGHHWSFQIRHISNAGIKDPNRGETMALVGVAFDP
ncbi:acyloxyacyl hydrolase [Dyella silvae]|uniref:acyloxyacyl hydrolase n=1 Tax=Dyella silvae TaxID=2994424 RepID=UPI0022640A48|nr:acyloxyacyl hydrolase [Dyella silvae]